MAEVRQSYLDDYTQQNSNIGIGTSFPAFTPGFTSVSIGTGKQVTLGEVDLTLLED